MSRKIKILFSCLMLPLVLGINGNIMDVQEEDKTLRALPLQQSWKAEHFLNAQFLVEEESNDQFYALRERRDTGTSEDTEGTGSGSADINGCELSGTCSPHSTCVNTIGSYDCECNDNFYGNGKVCQEISTKYSTTNVYAKAGEVALLVCTLNKTVFWKKDGRRLESTEDIKTFQNVLVVTPKSDEDFGVYFCELEEYKGRGINMTLTKISVDIESSSDSSQYLVAVVILTLLLVAALVAVLYLIRTSKKVAQNPRGRMSSGNYKNGNDNVMYDISSVAPASNQYDDNIYSNLSENRAEEPVYQSLVGQTRNLEVTDTSEAGLYEPLNLDLQSKV